MQHSLSGGSWILLPDGTEQMLREENGTLRMEERQWSAYRRALLQQAGRLLSERLSAHPERMTLYGLQKEAASGDTDLWTLLDR